MGEPVGGDENDHPDLSLEDRADAMRAARELHEAAEAAEPTVSPIVARAVAESGGRLGRCESRIKDPGSLYRKVQNIMAKRDLDAETASTWIRDSLRYTAVVDESGYWAVGDQIGEALVRVGYERKKVVEGWNRTGYRGRNDTFVTPGGLEFEVQIHTAASLGAAEVTHEIFQEQRLPTTTRARKDELRRRQEAIFASVPAPDDVVWID